MSSTNTCGPKAFAKCCGTTIQSKHVHDMVWCKCGKSFIDGGSDYTRCGGDVKVIDFYLRTPSIVERLEEAASQGLDLSPGDKLCANAASEIRLLQDEVTELEKRIHHLLKLNPVKHNWEHKDLEVICKNCGKVRGCSKHDFLCPDESCDGCDGVCE